MGCWVKAYIFPFIFLAYGVFTEVDYFPYFILEGVGGVIGYGGEVVVADELICLSDLFVSVPNY